jgi:dipeptidyl aminopeptidase/acylaminoacyl peptidase
LAADFAAATDDRYFYGNAWDHAQAYWDASPLKYVKNVVTPVLIIHSDNDIRTPIDQSLEMYSALKVLGRTTKLVQFPRDNHDLNRSGEPLHRVERLHLIADWLNAYLRP